MNYDPITLLQAEYLKRKQKNPQYSQRAFARDLGVSGSQLSEIFKKRQGISLKRANDIADRLHWNQSKRDFFCDLVQFKFSRIAVERERSWKRLKQNPSFKNHLKFFKKISEQRLQAHSDWVYFAVLELVRTHDFEPTPEFIARKLSITKTRAQRVLNRLLAINYFQIRDGVLVSDGDNFETFDDIPSLTIQKIHRRMIKKTLPYLHQSVHEREFQTLIMACPLSLLPKLKSQIREFINKVGSMPKKKPLDSVLALTIQLTNMTS